MNKLEYLTKYNQMSNEVIHDTIKSTNKEIIMLRKNRSFLAGSDDQISIMKIMYYSIEIKAREMSVKDLHTLLKFREEI